MDRRERIDSQDVKIRAALRGHQAGVWTALPSVVKSFNAAKLTVEAQPTVQAQVRTPGGTWVDATLPLCVDCPVEFPSGGGFVLTFPVAAGDEGLLVFASRCIDAWWQSGKVSPQAELRMHDLSDGFFFPGVFSVPRVPGVVSTNSAQLRSLDGACYVELAAGHVVNIVAPGGVNITGPVKVTGTLDVTGVTTLEGNLQLGGNVLAEAGGTYAGDLHTSGNVVARFGSPGSVGVATHMHTQAADAHGDAEQPTSAPTAGT